jgi:hypothetical protein
MHDAPYPDVTIHRPLNIGKFFSICPSTKGVPKTAGSSCHVKDSDGTISNDKKIGISSDAATHVQRSQHSKPLPQRVAQSIETSNSVSEVQVCESFRQRWYATKNNQAIIRCRFQQTQCNPHRPVLNPFQTQHMCLCHIRKTNQAIFQDRSNESPLQQYKMDALPKKHLPPISRSSLFGDICVAHTLHGSSIVTQHRKRYSNI